MNDLERYASLAESGWDPEPINMNDYKVLMSMGPFGIMAPDSTITLDVAYVAGKGLEDMLDQRRGGGAHVPGHLGQRRQQCRDGRLGRESLLYGPLKQFVPDLCAWDGGYVRAGARGDSIWVNADCFDEEQGFNNREQCRIASTIRTTTKRG